METMSTSNPSPNGADAPQAVGTIVTAGGPKLPDWITEDLFIDVLEEHVDGFKKVLNFEAKLGGGGGENYASIIVKVKVDVELEDGSRSENAFLMKTLLQGEQGAMVAKIMGVFPKEKAMYSVVLPEFEQMYREVGKNVTFAPKYYRFKNSPEADYVLMEDLSFHGFKNVNRLIGLDQEHMESVLKLLAEMHAASAVRFETRGEYDPSFMKSMFTDEFRGVMEMIAKSFNGPLLESMSKNEITSKYLDKIERMQNDMTFLFSEYGEPNPNEFNVIAHGDLWANNIMFRHNDAGKLEETVFVDFQMCRYSSPAADLLYFLFSSSRLDLKLSHFDDFIKFYHDQLVDNLKLLSYPKQIPTLKQIHLQILRQSFWASVTATGVMAAALCDPSEQADFENFLGDSDKGGDFKSLLFGNPRYIKHMEAILPWLDTRGYFDL